MNGEPHIHTLEVRQRWNTLPNPNQRGPWGVAYGDVFIMFKGEPTEEKIETAAKEAIHRHDQGSRDALARQKVLDRFQSRMNLNFAKWGSESIQ